MPKKVSTIVKLQIQAGKATPAPPVGTALGPHGLNIQEICQRFNADTSDKGDAIIPVEITVYEDRSYSMVYKTPPASGPIAMTERSRISSTCKTGSPNMSLRRSHPLSD